MLEFIRSNKVVATIVIVAMLSLVVNTARSNKKPANDITGNTVMVTTLDGTSGGSGSVINTNEKESEILTNAHVCHRMENGGMITTTTGIKSGIYEYKIDTDHDLCIIVVLKSLPSAAKISDIAPKVYDLSIASGHPNLLPNIVTHGHIAKDMMIDVFTGVKPCTTNDYAQRPDLCIFFGGIPIIKNYNSTVTSNLIMAGSSGSGVYGASGELTNVVFAGRGGEGLSFAFTVPYPNVKMFTNKYAGGKSREEFVKPNYASGEPSDDHAKYKEIILKCLTADRDRISKGVKQTCKAIITGYSWL